MKYFSTTFLFLAVLSVSSISCAAFSAAAPKGKKIFITFDGSLDSPEANFPNEAENKHITNPLKLHLLAGGSIDNESNDVLGQVCLYQRGIGTYSPSKIIQNIRFKLGRLSQQTRPMRKTLEKVYEEGDEIYIVGFSRGSAAARKFACNLNKKGLRKSNGKPVDIKFLGCFDTVSMQVGKNLISILRNSRKKELTKSSILGEKNGKLPDNIGTAVHHIALDDGQFAFPAFPPFPQVNMDSKDSRVHEAYFPGDHLGIGGGYYTKGIPDVSCKAMQDWLEEEGLEFIQCENIDDESLRIDRKKFFPLYLNAEDITITPECTSSSMDFMSDYNNKKSYRPVVAVTDEKEIEGGPVKVHVSALEHYEAMDKAGTPYLINPEIKNANFVIVDNLQKELKAETKKFKELLGM